MHDNKHSLLQNKHGILQSMSRILTYKSYQYDVVRDLNSNNKTNILTNVQKFLFCLLKPKWALQL